MATRGVPLAFEAIALDEAWFVVSPNGCQECAGCYFKDAHSPNLWNQAGGKFALSEKSGRWHVYAPKFEKVSGMEKVLRLCEKNPSRGGTVCSQVASVPWLRKDGDVFVDDPGIEVTKVPGFSPYLFVAGDLEQEHAGFYEMQCGQWKNGYPVWRHVRDKDFKRIDEMAESPTQGCKNMSLNVGTDGYWQFDGKAPREMIRSKQGHGQPKGPEACAEWVRDRAPIGIQFEVVEPQTWAALPRLLQCSTEVEDSPAPAVDQAPFKLETINHLDIAFLRDSLNKFAQEQQNPLLQLVYHYTTEPAAYAIRKTGFKVGEVGFGGGGIFFSVHSFVSWFDRNDQQSKMWPEMWATFKREQLRANYGTEATNPLRSDCVDAVLLVFVPQILLEDVDVRFGAKRISKSLLKYFGVAFAGVLNIQKGYLLRPPQTE